MFGLGFISVGLLHFATLGINSSVGQIECSLQKSVVVDVILVQDDVRYDFSKKTSELNRIGQGAYSPYGEGHLNIESRGLTVDEQSLNYNVKFYFEKHKETGLVCLQIQKVKVTINNAPTVYVSTKFKKGTPIFNKILEHEKEHVKITQRVNNKYKNILKQRLQNEFQSDFSTGVFPIDVIKQGQRELEGRVKRITAQVNRAMYKEAQRQHNLFDDVELSESIQYNQNIARKLEEILKISD